MKKITSRYQENGFFNSRWLRSGLSDKCEYHDLVVESAKEFGRTDDGLKSVIYIDDKYGDINSFFCSVSSGIMLHFTV